MRSIPTLTPFVQQVLDRYEARAPIAFAVRLSLEHTFAAPEIDAIFEVTRLRSSNTPHARRAR